MQTSRVAELEGENSSLKTELRKVRAHDVRALAEEQERLAQCGVAWLCRVNSC